MQEPLLKYRLPAVACPPPLILQVTPILPSETGSQKQSLLFVVQYCVNPKLSGALRDVTMTLQLPKPLGKPTKVCQLIFNAFKCDTQFAMVIQGNLLHHASICDADSGVS